jgi:hypothetical protein
MTPIRVAELILKSCIYEIYNFQEKHTLKTHHWNLKKRKKNGSILLQILEA